MSDHHHHQSADGRRRLGTTSKTAATTPTTATNTTVSAPTFDEALSAETDSLEELGRPLHQPLCRGVNQSSGAAAYVAD